MLSYSLFCSNFFEKSRIPVEELRHIWQLCDVTRDGALSLSEFTAAMHLVVLRRNNIPLPSSLPHCLHPNVLAKSTTTNASTSSTIPQEPPEADLLHLNDDDDDEHTDNTIISSTQQQQQPKPRLNDKNIMNLSSISTSSQASNSSSRREVTTPVLKHRSISNSPNVEKSTATAAASGAGGAVSSTNDASQWTKFSESPTTNATATASGANATTAAAANAATGAGVPAPTAVSSPGLKPALFDMKRTAQDVGSNPQILHPVPLRVTPIGTLSNRSIYIYIFTDMHLFIYYIIGFEGTAIASSGDPSGQQSIADVEGVVVLREDSPKAIATTTTLTTATMSSSTTSTTSSTHNIQRESNDLRAIQRPQAKKLPAKNNIGALPPPPQREPSIGSLGLSEPPDQATPLPPSSYATSSTSSVKKEPPPLPPPRPHRHARSSSLDLNKFKIGAAGAQQPEVSQVIIMNRTIYVYVYVVCLLSSTKSCPINCLNVVFQLLIAS